MSKNSNKRLFWNTKEFLQLYMKQTQLHALNLGFKIDPSMEAEAEAALDIIRKNMQDSLTLPISDFSVKHDLDEKLYFKLKELKPIKEILQQYKKELQQNIEDSSDLALLNAKNALDIKKRQVIYDQKRKNIQTKKTFNVYILPKGTDEKLLREYRTDYMKNRKKVFDSGIIIKD